MPWEWAFLPRDQTLTIQALAQEFIATPAQRALKVQHLLGLMASVIFVVGTPRQTMDTTTSTMVCQMPQTSGSVTVSSIYSFKGCDVSPVVGEPGQPVV